MRPLRGNRGLCLEIDGGVCYGHHSHKDRVQEGCYIHTAGLFVQIFRKAGSNGQRGHQSKQQDAAERLIGVEGHTGTEQSTVLQHQPDEDAAHVGKGCQQIAPAALQLFTAGVGDGSRTADQIVYKKDLIFAQILQFFAL